MDQDQPLPTFLSQGERTVSDLDDDRSSLSSLDSAIYSIKSQELNLDQIEIAFVHHPNSEGLKIKESCNICEEPRFTVICLECSQNLCENCLQFHEKFPATSRHQIIHLTPVNPIKQKKAGCDEHNKPFTLICIYHDELMCAECIASHEACKCEAIQNISKDVKVSEKFRTVQHNCEKLLSNLLTICEEMDAELSSVTGKVKDFRLTIAEHTKQIHEAMHVIEKEGLQLINQHKHNIEMAQRQLLEHKSKLESEYLNLKALTLQGSNKNTFIGMHKAEQNIAKVNENIENIFKENSVSSADLYLQFPVNIISTDRLGLIHKRINNLPYENENVESPSKTEINEIQLKHRLSVEFASEKNKTDISGCTILQNGEMWFSDRANDRVLIYDSEGILALTKQLNSSPEDISSNNDGKVAVSLPHVQTISILDTKRSHYFEDYFINVDVGTLSSLAYIDNNVLLVRVKGIGYYILDSSLQIVNIIHNSEKNIPYLACSKNHIYFSKWDVGMVNCMDLSGILIWTCSVDTVVQPANGVAADKKGNVFVSGTYSNSIAVISPDGSKLTSLNFDGRGLQNPGAIAYDTVKDRLLVNCQSGNAILFNIFRSS